MSRNESSVTVAIFFPSSFSKSGKQVVMKHPHCNAFTTKHYAIAKRFVTTLLFLVFYIQFLL